MLVAGVLGSALLAGCDDDGDGEALVDWVDFVRFGDVLYLGNPHGHGLTEDHLGAVYGRVQLKLSGNVNDPNYRSKDGDAGFLAEGTVLYEVAGYRPEFLLATSGGGRIDLYVADSVDGASVGREVLDIEGRVGRIQVSSEVDGVTELGAIEDAATIEAFVAAVVESPVGSLGRPPAGRERYFLDFELSHGIVVQRAYWADTGELSRGMVLPEAARAIIRAALAR